MSKLQSLFFSYFGSLYRGHPHVLTNALFAAATWAGEQAVENLAFSCPKNKEAVWIGWLFLCLPPVVLLIVGMVVSNELWYKFHGCVRRSEAAALSTQEKCLHFWSVLLKCMALPTIWTIVALFDGSYITCIYVENPEDTEETIRMQTFSSLIAWGLLIGMVVFTACVVCVNRCFDKNTFSQHENEIITKDVEKEIGEIKMKEVATSFVQEGWNQFFATSENSPSKQSWDIITVSDDILRKGRQSLLQKQLEARANNPQTVPVQDTKKAPGQDIKTCNVHNLQQKEIGPRRKRQKRQRSISRTWRCRSCRQCFPSTKKCHCQKP